MWSSGKPIKAIKLQRMYILTDREKAPLLGGSQQEDAALQCGSRHMYFTRILVHHGRGSKPCPLCDDQLRGQDLADHIFHRHACVLNLPHALSVDSLLMQIADHKISVVFLEKF